MSGKNLMHMLIAGIALIMVGACGGHGGSDTAATQPTTAVVKLSTSGTLATGVQLGAIDITAVLPEGVTLKAVPDTINADMLLTDDGVVTATGAAGAGTTALSGVYTAATSTTPGAVRLVLVNVPGFGIGEFCTVTADIAAGVAVTAADVVSLATFTARDESGNLITGLTATFTAVLQ
jgi:hypothetical protein